MDDIVQQAMAKWPNVPHCYGWLALDGRGAWRMRDERAQKLALPGDKITHPALLDFIRRNYQHDASGNWYFQNGPQRVYVNLAIAPFIARTDPCLGFIDQLGEVISPIHSAWINQEGVLFLVADQKVAAVVDHDMAACIEQLSIEDQPIDDQHLLAWIADAQMMDRIIFKPVHHAPIILQRLGHTLAEVQFGFIRQPAQAT